MTDDNLNTGGQSDNPFTPDPEEKGDKTLTLSEDDMRKILKQNASGQEFIETLKGETADLRKQVADLQEELSTNKSLEELMSDLQQTDQSKEPGPTATSVDKDALLKELKTEIFSELTAKEEADLKQQNWAKAVAHLKEVHGEGYDTYVAEKASELNMSTEQMADLAMTSPKAFNSLISGGEPKGTGLPTTPSSRPPLGDQTEEAEAEYSRVAQARKDLDTPEGREANRLWGDPQWQAKHRQRMLDKAKTEGSQYGNIIR